MTMNISIKIKNIEDTKKLAYYVFKNIFKGAVITLDGDLGAGKTTFVKEIGKLIGLKEEVNSPTFNILKCYMNDNINLYHIDAYRLEGLDFENKNIGLEEVIEGDGVCFIEWPEFINEFINSLLSLNIRITILNNNERIFNFETKNEKFSKLFNDLKEQFYD